MPKTYYDNFAKLAKDKMAQAMEDLTYLYNETKVPKIHYKKQLDKAEEELIESSVELNLVDTYYRTLEQLLKSNPKWLFQAMLCLDTKVKPSAITPAQYQAMELTWAKFQETKNAKTVDKQWLDYYTNIKDNGASYQFKTEEE